MDDPAHPARCSLELLFQEIEKCCLQNSISFEILLVVENTPTHPPFVDGLYHYIKVMFLPPSTNSLIQLMYQSVIAPLKAYYLRRTFDEPIAATEEDTQKTLIQMCKNYKIYDCIYKPSLGVTKE